MSHNLSAITIPDYIYSDSTICILHYINNSCNCMIATNKLIVN